MARHQPHHQGSGTPRTRPAESNMTPATLLSVRYQGRFRTPDLVLTMHAMGAVW
jgi:hypothetical protein